MEVGEGEGLGTTVEAAGVGVASGVAQVANTKAVMRAPDNCTPIQIFIALSSESPAPTECDFYCASLATGLNRWNGCDSWKPCTGMRFSPPEQPTND